MTAASPVPITSSVEQQPDRIELGEAIQAVAGLALSALDYIAAAILGKRFSADPARIAAALRPNTEEIILLAPLVGLALSGISPKRRAQLALGVLGVWFLARIIFAAQAGAFARATAAERPAAEPTPVPAGSDAGHAEKESNNGQTTETPSEE